jgi:hypothetical protein
VASSNVAPFASSIRTTIHSDLSGTTVSVIVLRNSVKSVRYGLRIRIATAEDRDMRGQDHDPRGDAVSLEPEPSRVHELSWEYPLSTDEPVQQQRTKNDRKWESWSWPAFES